MYLLAPIFWLLAFKKSFFGSAFCLEFALPFGLNFPCRFRRVCLRRHTLDKFTLHTSQASSDLASAKFTRLSHIYPHTKGVF
ncbi:hypothetical protein IO358_000130 [Campylobacter upsaliensis]|nr:hypothetical protein [Campylobacter upsaliensis]